MQTRHMCRLAPGWLERHRPAEVLADDEAGIASVCLQPARHGDVWQRRDTLDGDIVVGAVEVQHTPVRPVAQPLVDDMPEIDERPVPREGRQVACDAAGGMVERPEAHQPAIDRIPRVQRRRGLNRGMRQATALPMACAMTCPLASNAAPL